MPKNKKQENLSINKEIAQLRNIIYEIPGCVYWKDKKGVYLGCNKGFLEIAGLNSVDQVIGKTDFDLCWAEQAEILRKNDKEVMLFGPIHFEESVTLSNQEKLTYTVVKSPLYDEKGEVIGVIGTSLDISQQKRLAEELRVARDKAEALSKAKSEFILNMSHDVKTPLSGIIGLAEILTYQLKEKELTDFAQMILDSGNQLLIFFDNCLEMTKLEGTNLIQAKEYFNLRNLVNELTDLFQPAIQSKNLDYYVNFDENIPGGLIGSRAGLYRILMNLIGNAVKFTKSGSVSITIQVGKKTTRKKMIIKISIEDTGIGIPEDKQKIIFERFTRLTPSYKGIYEGSGIGLYIVQRFIHSMGGEIYLQSEEGKGSRFTIILPLEVPLLSAQEYQEGKLLSTSEYKRKQSDAAKPSLKKEHLEPEIKNFTNEEKPSDKRRVLLIEDNPIAQRLAGRLLSSLYCEVEIAETGKKALDLYRSGKFDFILVDIGLPDIPGY